MSEFITKLIEHSGHFLTRDVMYVVGGGSLCVTLLYVSGQPLTNEYPTAIWLLAAGVAYGIGYAVQEILSLAPFLTTAPVLEPGRLVQWLYRRFTRTGWNPIDLSIWPRKKKQFDENASDRPFIQLQRTIGLKHIGSTLGSNWLVCAIILGIYSVWSKNFQRDLLLAIGTLCLSIGLIGMSWVKGAQQTQHVWTWEDRAKLSSLRTRNRLTTRSTRTRDSSRAG